METDCVVIGAGVVGLAVAARLAADGREVLVLEQGDHFGEGISSRNSEVIHAGLYYPEDSLKAQLCVEGRERLYRYCQDRHIRHQRLGKWIVAGAAQLEDLESVAAQAARNGVPMQRVGAGVLARELPEVRAAEALFSPETGIVDSHALMISLLADLESAGGQMICRAPVEVGSSETEGHRILIGGGVPCELLADCVVNAAGLGSATLAQNWKGRREGYRARHYYARGVYFSYTGSHPFRQLVYPVPEPGGLGVHLTLDLAGQARFGPDVEWVDEPDFSVDEGRRESFARAIRSWWPGLDATRLQPAYAGVRPKLAGSGSGFQDFRVDGPQTHGIEGLVHLLGIESPGLTASLALAEHVRRVLA
jgi:L-2-hydroxyglutarate oxidase LhgO